jgi:hypothetical protein
MVATTVMRNCARWQTRSVGIARYSRAPGRSNPYHIEPAA